MSFETIKWYNNNVFNCILGIDHMFYNYLITKISRKHFKKNNTSNWLLANLLAIDSVAFYLMTKVVESNMYPFLNILNIFP